MHIFFHDDFFRFANILNAQFNLKLIILKDETGNYPPPPLPGLTETPPPQNNKICYLSLSFSQKMTQNSRVKIKKIEKKFLKRKCRECDENFNISITELEVKPRPLPKILSLLP